MITITCWKHPKYKIMKKPTARGCDCLVLWKAKQYAVKHPDTCSCVRILKQPFCTLLCID